MSRRSKEAKAGEYDLRSNLKDKPNAQGTLFSGGERTPESRQPRGYSPERLREVGSYFGLHKDAAKHYGAWQQGYGHWADVAQTVARSTVPLNGQLRAPESPATGEYAWGPSVRVAGTSRGNFAGEYFRPNPRSRQGDEDADGVINIRPDQVRSATVIHELGHHADYMRGSDGNFSGSTARDLGRREAFADNYAQEHAREPGYKHRPAQDYVTTRSTGHSWNGSYGDISSDQFNSGYRRDRTRPNSNLSFAQFQAQGSPLFAPLQRPVEGGGVSTRFVHPDTFEEL